MSGVPANDVRRGCVLILFALLPGYLAMEGLITGHTRAFSRHGVDVPHTGTAGIVTAIAYAFMAAALILAAMHFFSANPKRRTIFARWGRIAMALGPVILLLGVIAQIVGAP